MTKQMAGFVNFIRTQGVMGLAVGLVLGTAVKDVVNALVTDFINPIIGLFMGGSNNLEVYELSIAGVTFAWGHFVSVLINFVVIAAVVYFIIQGLGLDKIDKSKKD